MKHVPERMCVACRVMRPKSELARVIRPVPNGDNDAPKPEAVIDLTGKSHGRGAYLCYNEACLKKARKTRALERALKTSLSENAYEHLAGMIANHEA